MPEELTELRIQKRIEIMTDEKMTECMKQLEKMAEMDDLDIHVV